GGEAIGDGNGAYTVRGLARREYVVLATAGAGSRYRERVLAPGHLDLVLERGGRLSGDVRCVEGNPAGHTTIVVESAAQGRRDLRTVSSDERGHFDLADLASGRYSVRAMRAGRLAAWLPDIELAAGKLTTVELRLLPSVSLK